jgi:hypothetical protein
MEVRERGISSATHIVAWAVVPIVALSGNAPVSPDIRKFQAARHPTNEKKMGAELHRRPMIKVVSQQDESR